MTNPGIFKVTVLSIAFNEERVYLDFEYDGKVTQIDMLELGAQRALVQTLRKNPPIIGGSLFLTFKDVYGLYNGKIYKVLKCTDASDNEPTQISLYTLEENASEYHKNAYDQRYISDTTTSKG